MSIKPKDIEIPPGNPFKNCKLGREKYAKVLTGIVSTYSDGFVLAVNNEWGTGKTTFVKMWQQQLENQNFKTRYFNAWENDYNSNPLAALISELKMPTHDFTNTDLDSVLKKAAVVSKSVLPAFAKALASRYFDTELITDAFKNTTEAASEIFKEQISEHEKKKKGLIEFRNEIEKYLSKYSDGKPLVFIIDELDRCRPDYAVEVLETVKHLFSVSGIVFVLSIDKQQLCNAVKGFYGSHEINADEYLRRFIDLEFVIPSPTTGDYCKYLYEYFDFDSYFKSIQRQQYYQFSLDSEDFQNFSAILFENGMLNLRQQERVFAHAVVVLNLFKENTFLFPTIYILLIYIRFVNAHLYRRIKEKQLSPQNLIDELKKYLPEESKKTDDHKIIYTIALIVFLYHNSYISIHGDWKLWDYDSETELMQLYVELNFVSPELDLLFQKYLLVINKEFTVVKLNYLLEIIDLTENLNV